MLWPIRPKGQLITGNYKEMKKIILVKYLLLVQITLYGCICVDKPFGIDSINDLVEYDFIGLVEIKGEKTKTDAIYDTYVNLLDIRILEHFKGENPKGIKEYDVFSSCELGIEVGEEWILFAFQDSTGTYSVGACERNIQYKGINGKRYNKSGYSWGISYLEKLRQLYGKPTPRIKNGKREEYYNNGSKELEEVYKKSKLNGVRKIWYPNGQLMLEEVYLKGKKDGECKSYFPSGQVAYEDYFKDEKKCCISRIYYDTIYHNWEYLRLLEKYKTEEVLKSVYDRIQVKYETIYNDEGEMVSYNKYRRNGKIEEETLYFDELRKFIHYYENGSIRLIYYYKNGKPFGDYTSYFENGLIDKLNSWEYDLDGKKKK